MSVNIISKEGLPEPLIQPKFAFGDKVIDNEWNEFTISSIIRHWLWVDAYSYTFKEMPLNYEIFEKYLNLIPNRRKLRLRDNNKLLLKKRLFWN